MDNFADGWEEFFTEYKNQLPRRAIRWDRVSETLLQQYVTHIHKRISRLPSINNTKQEVIQCLDLIKAIYAYRSNPDSDLYLKTHPELGTQEEYLRILWSTFKSSTQDEIFNMISGMFIEIEAHLQGQYLDE